MLFLLFSVTIQVLKHHWLKRLVLFVCLSVCVSVYFWHLCPVWIFSSVSLVCVPLPLKVLLVADRGLLPREHGWRGGCLRRSLRKAHLHRSERFLLIGGSGYNVIPFPVSYKKNQGRRGHIFLSFSHNLEEQHPNFFLLLDPLNAGS